MLARYHMTFPSSRKPQFLPVDSIMQDLTPLSCQLVFIPEDEFALLPFLLAAGQGRERGRVLPFSIFFRHRLHYSANVLMQDLTLDPMALLTRAF